MGPWAGVEQSGGGRWAPRSLPQGPEQVRVKVEEARSMKPRAECGSSVLTGAPRAPVGPAGPLGPASP